MANAPSRTVSLDNAYEPYPHQLELHQSTCQNLGAIGGNGSGKSAFLLWHAILNYALRYEGCDSLLLRRNFRELDKGLISDLKNIGLTYNPDGQLWNWNDTKHIATFYNGSKIYFGHMENGVERDLHQYLSSSFCLIGVDEAGQISYGGADFLKSRNRVNPGCKPDAEGNFPLPQFAIATNPLGPGWGWIRKLYLDKEPFEKTDATIKDDNGYWWVQEAGNWICVYNPTEYKSTHSTILDNPNLMSRDPGYIARLQKLSPALRAKALYGDINAVSGQYYSNFEPAFHVINLRRDPEAIKWQDFQPRWIGWDFGIGHYSAVYFMTRALVRKLDDSYKPCVVVYREIVCNETSSRDLCKRIAASMRPNGGVAALERGDKTEEKIQHIFFSHEKFSRTGTDTEHRPADDVTRELRHWGLPPVSRASNDRVAGAVLIYNMLEQGDLVFLDSCTEIIAALPALQRNVANLEDVQKTESRADDCFDALKYGLLSMLHPRKASELSVMQTQAAKIEDHTAKFFFYAKMQKQLAAKNDTVKPKRIPIWQAKLENR